MIQPTKECDAFLMDTYRSVSDQSYHPGAITFKKRKTVEVLQWEESFESQHEADMFVRDQLAGKHGIKEVASA